jgi:hypothetical protein
VTDPVAVTWGLFVKLEAAESEIGTDGLLSGWAIVAALLRKLLIEHAETCGSECVAELRAGTTGGPMSERAAGNETKRRSPRHSGAMIAYEGVVRVEPPRRRLRACSSVPTVAKRIPREPGSVWPAPPPYRPPPRSVLGRSSPSCSPISQARPP